jgi:tRNA(Ile)-lysidine synthase
MDASRKSPSTDALIEAAADCLARQTRPNDTIAVGLSGGVDSVVLLHVLSRLGRSITAVHVHHGLQSEADHWADFCASLCISTDVPLVLERVMVELTSGDGLEAAARRARHGAFSRVQADWIALGHHRGDRAETLLLNLLRGAGVRGAGALRERDRRLLRPLLTVGRSDILAYAELHGLSWVDDPSNGNLHYSRNFVRHRLLATASQRFPAAECRLARAAGRFEEATELLDELAKLDLAGHPQQFPLPVSILVSLSEPRARNVLRYLLQKCGIGIPSEERLKEALRQFLNAAHDRHPMAEFGDWMLRRRRGQVHLEPMYRARRGVAPL